MAARAMSASLASVTFSWDELAWSAVAAADILSLECAMVSVVACCGNRTSTGGSSVFWSVRYVQIDPLALLQRKLRPMWCKTSQNEVA